MKKIEFGVANKRYEYSMPENWNEVTEEQFKSYVQEGSFTLDLVRRVIGMDDVVAASLTPADWWRVCQEFKWMKETDGIGKLYIDKVTLKDGTVCYGYNSDFSDVTWEEWMFADTYASRGRWDVVAAVLYRPEKENWDHESDRRIAFSKFGASDRTPMMAELDETTLASIKVNYLLLRKRMTDHYYHIFTDYTDDAADGELEKKKQGPTDWLTIIRNMMGDFFYEEQKYYQLSVPSVLFQLESRVKEAKKNGK